jgi:hypothetical protein
VLVGKLPSLFVPSSHLCTRGDNEAYFMEWLWKEMN